MSTKVWTFQVIGGDAFALQPEGNPAVGHDGALSIWHLVLDDEQADEIAEVIRTHGARVEQHAQTEDPEQTELHQRILDATDGVFPCVQCSRCFWLDVQVEGYCGYRGWEPERRDAALELVLAQQDLAKCPVLPTH